MKYTLPAMKMPKSKENEEPMESAMYDRQVRIPANTEILKGLTLGGVQKVTLEGKVIQTKAKGKFSEPLFELEVTSVEVPEGKNVFEELAEEDDDMEGES